MKETQQFMKNNMPWIWIVFCTVVSILYLDGQLFIVLSKFKEFFNSVFFMTIAAAFAGAYGAQRIADRSKYRVQLLDEIRCTNTAIMLSSGICDSLLQMKIQHVKSLREDWDSQNASRLDHAHKRISGLISEGQELRVSAKILTFSLPHLPTDILQKQVFEKLSLTGRPISLTTTLVQTIHNLNASFAARNQLIDTYRAKKGISDVEYFGLPENGMTDDMYPSLVKAIYEQTEDGIFFSQLLCQDMIEHGNNIAAVFNNKFKEGAPTISKVDFSKAEKASLMPNADNYPDWFTNFIKSSDEATKQHRELH